MQKARLRELAFARLQTYETWVLQTYSMLPTDARFLELRPWECEYLYWTTVMWRRMGKRFADNLPVKTIEHVLEDELFEEELARREAADDAKVVEEKARPLPPERLESPVEPVSRWRAREEPT